MIHKWGAKRKRMLFSRREEEQAQWVIGMTDKCRGQRVSWYFEPSQLLGIISGL